ncbi:hypothetical protein ACIRSS_46195 [Amycolatopsis sp. NPDC101161]|uniref:hypothetical protein n=1 Tax=Amycolatopsis sp. NPDC101161 TaxID=3363940 RepID=UPI0037FEE5F6
MNGVLTSVIAVCGTLAGSALTYLFARLTARRTEKAAREERHRQELIAACAEFAGSMTELRQRVVSLWFVRQLDPDGAAARAAFTEADQSGAAADRARFAVRLLTGNPEILRLADAAFDPVGAIRKAADRAELREHEDRSQEILTAFIEAAGRHLR